MKTKIVTIKKEAGAFGGDPAGRKNFIVQEGTVVETTCQQLFSKKNPGVPVCAPRIGLRELRRW